MVLLTCHRLYRYIVRTFVPNLFLSCLSCRCAILHILFLLVTVILGGCQNRYVTCRSEYLYPHYLASERINTLDPCRKCYFGQQIIVRWSLPRSCFLNSDPILLRLQIRYGNREIETLTSPIKKQYGWKIHRLINQDYWCRGGILSFKAELIRDEEVFDSWTHYLWAELIEISR